jgi:uncharacterized protein YjiS (DUF1127 family)
MTTTAMTQSASQPRGFDLPGVAARAVGLIGQLFRAYHNRSAVAVLGVVSDQMLADIGLTRSDVRDAFAEPVWRDPTRLMRDRAAERRGRRRAQ